MCHYRSSCIEVIAIAHKHFCVRNLYQLTQVLASIDAADFQNYARETKAVPVPAEYEVIYGAADEIMQPLATRVLKKKK